MNRHLLGLAASVSLLLGGSLFSTAATADAIKIGIKAEISAADPHVLFGPNRNIGGQVYEPLFLTDAAQKPMPGLVESWTVIEPKVWEFKLRQGVKFHDGSALTAEDVKFSIERARDLDAPRTFRTYLKDVTDVTVVDDLTFRVTTKEPSAILIPNLSTFGVVKKAVAEGATEADFNGGKAAIGTGPYRWIKWTPGEGVKLEAFNDYWGGKPNFERVDYRFIANDSTRTAALLSGDVQMVDDVPPALVKRLQSEKAVEVVSGTSYMLNYVGLDMHHDVPLFVSGPNGEKLTANPFRDVRVRKALTMAINRQLIADRIMGGLATPAGQFVPKGMVGHIDGVEAAAYDPEGAKKLLAEAGFPDGFRLTIHCTNDRYTNDAKVCEAIGQMLTVAGVKTEVQTLPSSVFFDRATSGGPNGEPEFSFFMLGFGAANGVADAAYSALVQSYDKKAGTGANNRSRYSNAELDKLIGEAVSETDEAKRAALLDKVTRLAMDDVAMIPVHFLNGIWGVSEGYKLTPRTDLFTLVRLIEKTGD